MGETSNEDLREDPDVAALKADIEETRESIGQTLEAIGEKLSPGNMVHEAADSVKEAAARKVGNVMETASQRASDLANQARDTVDTVREQVSNNTLPATLVAIGLGWYAFRAIRDGNRRGYSGRRLSGQGSRWADERDRRWNGEYTAVSDQSGRWNEASESVAGQGERWNEGQYGYRSGDSGRSPQQVIRRVGDLSQRASSEVSRIFRQNPLAVGVAAAAVGVAIGLSVPETEVEDRVLGETRDSVMDRAREAVAHPLG
jgi:ElaB/YqjD/DUF883 family membrane-anchored ribosome-binding protein